MPLKTTKFIWHEGRLVPWEQATVHVLSHALHYGSSVFEGIRVYQTPIGAVGFRLTDHVRRLFQSAKIYRMKIPYSREAITAACREVVRENGLKGAYIRPIAFRGYGELGVAGNIEQPASVSIAAWEWGSYLGDGALGQGVVYEVMNMAALWKLPIIYLCENNLYNEYTHNSETLAGDMLTRAAGFGIPGQAIDGHDVRKVYATAKEVIDRVRRGAGPVFLVCNTYRFMGHHVGDVNREYYRSKQEEQTWKTERDPIKVMADWLIKEGLADAARLERMQAEVKAEVEKAVEFATAAPYPSADKVDQDVYA